MITVNLFGLQLVQLDRQLQLYLTLSLRDFLGSFLFLRVLEMVLSSLFSLLPLTCVLQHIYHWLRSPKKRRCHRMQQLRGKKIPSRSFHWQKRLLRAITFLLQLHVWDTVKAPKQKNETTHPAVTAPAVTSIYFDKAHKWGVRVAQENNLRYSRPPIKDRSWANPSKRVMNEVSVFLWGWVL